MTERPFPEDDEFREAFTHRLTSHDFARGPLVTEFLSPWEEALARAELLLHGRALHLSSWGGARGVWRRVLAIDAHRPLPLEEFPLAAVRIRPTAAFLGLQREEALLALSDPPPDGAGVPPANIGDLAQLTGAWAAVCIAQERPIVLQSELVTVEPFSLAEYAALPVRPPRIRTEGTVAAMRLDAIASLVHRPTREQFKRLTVNGGAMVNYRYARKGSALLQLGDVLSLRGFPTVQVMELGDPTKKGRAHVRVAAI